tara:strand:+ start:665 stop:1750 length:1086 start_codon:yes stop_codon:yes gene_type:complete
MKQHNFSAGPSILPHTVIEKASKSVLNLNNTGLSILEISHRSKGFVDIINEARKLTKELLNIPNEYEVLFLQGGASLQFYMCALNIAQSSGTGGYIDTGTWSTKAIKEAKKVRKIIIAASSKEDAYTHIPKNVILNEKIDYLHFTSNNTIYGTQFHDFSKLSDIAKSTGAKLICDMSSDIFSKEFNLQSFDLIYAGAQKNIGPAGTTLVIIKKSILEERNNLPTYLNYKTHIDKESMFNTPPVFSIYVAMLTLRWIKNLGGLSIIEKNNNKKAKIMYAEIDRNPLFSGIVNIEDRSIMNATFSLNNKKLETRFDAMCHSAGISGIKGHRSVGGYRASMYNALSIDSVSVLIEVMKQLERIA